jgi:hypothetical protein
MSAFHCAAASPQPDLTGLFALFHHKKHRSWADTSFFTGIENLSGLIPF